MRRRILLMIATVAAVAGLAVVGSTAAEAAVGSNSTNAKCCATP